MLSCPRWIPARGCIVWEMVVIGIQLVQPLQPAIMPLVALSTWIPISGRLMETGIFMESSVMTSPPPWIPVYFRVTAVVLSLHGTKTRSGSCLSVLCGHLTWSRALAMMCTPASIPHLLRPPWISTPSMPLSPALIPLPGVPLMSQRVKAP